MVKHLQKSRSRLSRPFCGLRGHEVEIPKLPLFLESRDDQNEWLNVRKSRRLGCSKIQQAHSDSPYKQICDICEWMCYVSTECELGLGFEQLIVRLTEQFYCSVIVRTIFIVRTMQIYRVSHRWWIFWAASYEVFRAANFNQTRLILTVKACVFCCFLNFLFVSIGWAARAIATGAEKSWTQEENRSTM